MRPFRPRQIGDEELVFRCPTESLASLEPAGIEVANLGKNHSSDYGKEALVGGRGQLSSATTPTGCRPMETLNDAAVFWGLGNFVWPRCSKAGSTTAIGRAIVHPDGSIEACLIPAFIENPGQPVATGEPPCGPGR